MTSAKPGRTAQAVGSGCTVTCTRPGANFGGSSSCSVPSGFNVPCRTISLRLMVSSLRYGNDCILSEREQKGDAGQDEDRQEPFSILHARRRQLQVREPARAAESKRMNRRERKERRER